MASIAIPLVKLTLFNLKPVAMGIYNLIHRRGLDLTLIGSIQANKINKLWLSQLQ